MKPRQLSPLYVYTLACALVRFIVNRDLVQIGRYW